ncbi:MAG TPA: molybdenum cofactor guanylyltransferase [Chitinophagaceae bacterium]|nr:molybdenum cofactor guanylyltransferase [Chitinophagaceae bacterium]
MPESKEITAIILAGGKSTRMKTEKGLVSFGGKMIIEHVIDALKKITQNIIIVTANPVYKQFGYPCFEDEMENKGPLGGIFTGLIHSGAQKNLVVGCDMPFLSVNVLASLVINSGDEDVLLTEHLGKAEPLCSVYDRSCIPYFKTLLEKNQLKITDALKGLKTRVTIFDKEEWFKGNEFTNINSIDELKKYDP